jgi:hypothetical protein
MVPAAIVAVGPILAWLVLDHLGTPKYAFVGVAALLLAVYIGLWHPLRPYGGPAVVLAGLPFGASPGIHVPPYCRLPQRPS